jgi:hypothetical protein
MQNKTFAALRRSQEKIEKVYTVCEMRLYPRRCMYLTRNICTQTLFTPGNYHQSHSFRIFSIFVQSARAEAWILGRITQNEEWDEEKPRIEDGKLRARLVKNEKYKVLKFALYLFCIPNINNFSIFIVFWISSLCNGFYIAFSECFPSAGLCSCSSLRKT